MYKESHHVRGYQLMFMEGEAIWAAICDKVIGWP